MIEPLPRKTQAFAVIKANAYGHGAVAVARRLASQVAGFCVSNLDEAFELRQAGIEHPILILGVIPVDDLHFSIEVKYQCHSCKFRVVTSWLKHLVRI